MKKETILAVRSSSIRDILRDSGFHTLDEAALFARLADAGLWLGPRFLLEEDETFRQIIPYVVLRHGSAIACYQRTPAGGEGRLHGKLSIGFGGHIEAIDAVYREGHIDARKTVEAGANRELVEELGPLRVLQKRWSGLIVENDSAVGRVHLGIVAEWLVDSSAVSSAEDGLKAVRFLEPRQFDTVQGEIETWSGFVLSRLRPANQV